MPAGSVKKNGCVVCGGTTRWETRDDLLDYKGHTRTLKTRAWWCLRCGEAVLEGKTLMDREAAYFQLRADADGVLSPREVARVRKRVGLSQRRASQLLGGGPRSFQKYESGETPPSIAMSHLLRLLEKDPNRLGELTGTAKKRGGRRRAPRSATRTRRVEHPGPYPG
jgi:HTH-type transcriptional regulator/antitoxin MqsA